MTTEKQRLGQCQRSAGFCRPVFLWGEVMCGFCQFASRRLTARSNGADLHLYASPTAPQPVCGLAGGSSAQKTIAQGELSRAKTCSIAKSRGCLDLFFNVGFMSASKRAREKVWGTGRK